VQDRFARLGGHDPALGVGVGVVAVGVVPVAVKLDDECAAAREAVLSRIDYPVRPDKAVVCHVVTVLSAVVELLSQQQLLLPLASPALPSLLLHTAGAAPIGLARLGE